MNENTFAAIEIMGMGMAGIVAVMAVFYGLITLIDKIFPSEEDLSS